MLKKVCQKIAFFMAWSVMAVAVLRYLFSRKPGDPQTLIVIRLDETGDLILSLPAIHRLRQQYPAGRWRLCLFCKPALNDFATFCPDIDQVVSIDPDHPWTDPAELLVAGEALAGCALLINPALSRLPETDLIATLAWKAVRRRFQLRQWYRDGLLARLIRQGEHFYQALIPLPTGLHITMALPDLFDLLPAVEPLPPPPKPPRPTWLPDSPFALVAPGAGHPGRCWPPERFAAILAQLAKQRPDWHFLLCGSPAENQRLESLRQLLPENLQPQVARLDNGDGFLNIWLAVPHACFLLGNDSAPFHAAAFWQTPAVSILGRGHFGTFGPYPDTAGRHICSVWASEPCQHCQWHCHRKDASPEHPFPCIEAVKETDVWAAVCAALDLPTDHA